MKLWRLAAAFSAIALLLSSCASGIAGSGRLVIGPSASTTTAPPVQAVCPSIVDTIAHLSFRCVDDSLEFSFTGQLSGFSTSMQLSTEPTWVAEQDVGPLASRSRQTAQSAVQDLASYMVRTNYGTNPTSAVQKQGAVTVPGAVSAYRQDVLVTLNPTYRSSQNLSVRTELLSITVVEVSAGSFSVMLMSVPDTQQQWWANYDATVASLSVN